MRKATRFAAIAALFSAASALAGEKNMMHCFAFTVEQKATPADWEAFYKASDAMPKEMKGIVNRVWYGKLNAPLAQYAVPADARKRLQAGETEVEAKIQYRPRQWGMCMELNGVDKLKAYADHPYHKTWVDVYSKVRVAGTTTYDIIGQ
jgi:hypothetical protein